jgi:ABC-type proline/glycine betaine transport system ATPase subunit
MAIRDGTKFTVEYGIQTPTSKTILVVTEDLEEAQRTLDMIGTVASSSAVSYSPWVEVDARAQTSG